MARLTVLCFAGTYALALLAELARVAVRAPTRSFLTVGLTALAWVVQTAYLANLVATTRAVPMRTLFDSMLVLSWILGAIGLYLMVRSSRTAVGAFVLPIVVVLASLAGTSAPRQADWRTAWGGATAFWGMVHGAFLLAGAVSTCMAFEIASAKRPRTTRLSLSSA